MSHTELSSKEDFQKAIETPGKYVFILAYDGDKPADADSYAQKFADKVATYQFDLSKAPAAKSAQNIEKTPCAILYKDGKLVKKVQGMDPSEMKEIGQMLAQA